MHVLHRAALALAGLCLVSSPALAANPLDTFDSFDGTRGAARAETGVAPPSKIAPLRLVLQVGYDAGRYETGFFGTNDNDAMIGLHLNEGPNFGVGFNWSPAGVPGGVQLTVGYERAQAKWGAAKMIWSAVPVELMGFLQLEPIRLGVGTSNLLQSSLKSDGISPAIEVKFDVSTGWVLELDWVAPMRQSERGSQSSLGVRYVFQKVKSEGIEYDASAMGVALNLTL